MNGVGILQDLTPLVHGFRAQGFQPFDLHQQTIADQAVFAEMPAQGLDFAMVTAVERGKGGEGGKRHDRVLDCRKLRVGLQSGIIFRLG